MPRRAQMVDALWASLPAATGREVASRLTDQLGRFIDKTEAFHLMSYVRRHCDRYGWTVLHASRKAVGNFRFMRVALTHDADFTATDEILKNAEIGEVANVRHIAQRYRNSAAAMKALTQQMGHGTRRFKIDSVAEDASDLVRKAERLAVFLEEPAANGSSEAQG